MWADILEFGKAIALHWGAYVSGGAPWAIDGFLKRLSSAYGRWSDSHKDLRRKVEIGALLVGFLVASFQAWQDEKAKFNRAEVQRLSSQDWLTRWKARADKVGVAIDGPGGYREQLRTLQGLKAKGPIEGPLKGAGPLKRLIAYSEPNVDQQNTTKDGKPVSYFQGFSFRFNNVSADTIKMRLDYVRAALDGKEIMNGCQTGWSVVAQTLGITPACHRATDDLSLTPQDKLITIEFQVLYDTIPATGVRKSYRKLIYAVDFANGPDNAPFVTLHQIETQRED